MVEQCGGTEEQCDGTAVWKKGGGTLEQYDTAVEQYGATEEQCNGTV